VIERVDGEVKSAGRLDMERVPVRDTARPNAEEAMLKTDPEPDAVVRWPAGGERARAGRVERLDGRGEGEEATSMDGRKVRGGGGVA
jgi:hypothetical protein